MKLDRLKMHQEWFDKNQHLIFLEARIVMQELLAMTREARNERDEARLQTGQILNEIDCRVEHGADSNGHLEAILKLFSNKEF